MISKNPKVDSIFKHVKTLPSLPPVVQKIFASINDPHIGAKQIADIISKDQSLTARVLKLVNSSFFGLRERVQNIYHAVTMLGFSTIRQICLGISICSKFDNIDTSAGFSGESFWAHSIAASILARETSKKVTDLEPDACYTIGLVHDVGKLLLLEHHRDRYLRAIAVANERGIPLNEAEEAEFGLDHTDVGSWLFHKWNLPRDARRAVKNHHSAVIESITPVSGDALTAIIYFANQLCYQMDIGNAGNVKIDMDPAKFKGFFGREIGELGLDRVRIEEEVQISMELLGLGRKEPESSPSPQAV